ncbi:exocyst complex component 5-like [Xenia sp. Carnegie-2017]|uniref:exocyst complex component 5-like n=1 Tax=Xenia sp. Carnegie-2017 TaxID=2897299 RepID=UPI001F03BCD1|nr:exocyst complex component 5-like [Xenia sp. Carnegie-2017]
MFTISEADFKEPFACAEYVERLASTVEGGGTKGGEGKFDPNNLHSFFVNSIHQLELLDKSIQGQVNKLEELCTKEEKEHKGRIVSLEDEIKRATKIFHTLDNRINSVATNVVHLGDQLEGINTPRQRAKDTLQLMEYFNEFLVEGTPTSTVFHDEAKIHEAANVIQKLNQISQELPNEERFKGVKEHIDEYYKDIGDKLITLFKRAHHEGDQEKMKTIAETLQPFNPHNQNCVDVFISESQKSQFNSQDVFKDVVGLCRNVNSLVKFVFGMSGGMVMDKLVQDVYEGAIKKYVDHKLDHRIATQKESYLENLYVLYRKTKELGQKLSECKLGPDLASLSRLRRNIFSNYLKDYEKRELEYLIRKSESLLNKYYESIGHQKREKTHMSGFNDFVRMTGLSQGPQQQSDNTKETYLNQDVAVSLLLENKKSLQRCELLCNPDFVPSCVHEIYSILLNCLCRDHLDYALTIGLEYLPAPEPKSIPNSRFLEVVDQANAIFHLLEKHFSDAILPLVGSSTTYGQCVRKKKEIMEDMEKKLDNGMERLITSYAGYVKHVLNTEQKKSDFRPPEEQNADLFSCTQACKKCCQFIEIQRSLLKDYVDGKNLECALTEFGIRVHRHLVDHLQQFQYNSIGGMLAICDINEYRKCIQKFEIKLLDKLFNTLHSLGNLLIVAADNIPQVIKEEQLAPLEKSVIQSFVQLRADYKTSKLARHLE